MQRLQPLLQFVDQVVDPDQVIVGRLQLPLSLLFLLLKVEHPGCFFENSPSFPGLGIEDLVHPPLGNNSQAVLGNAGVQKESPDIPQTGRLLVNQVFIVAGL